MYFIHKIAQFFTLMRLAQPAQIRVCDFQHWANFLKPQLGARKLLASALDLKSESDQSELFLALQAPS